MDAVDIYRATLDPGEIRLVRILPGEWSDDIQCELNPESLESTKPYKALSYVWGSQAVTRPILVNGECSPVTVNLECALRHLRERDEVVRIWIDALCINQKNNEERNHQDHPQTSRPLEKQGRQRKMVFNNDGRDDQFIDDFVHRWTILPKPRKRPTIFDVFCLLSGIARSREGSDPLHHLRNLKEGNIGLLLESLRMMMMMSPWWGRIWIVQEVVLASHVRVQCGNVTAPWEMFAQAARSSALAPNITTILKDDGVIFRGFAGIVTDIDHRREAWRGQTPSRGNFLSILREFSSRRASDDRDKVYALLTLAEGLTSIVPDYDLDTPEVFTNTIKDVIRTDSTLHGLCGDLGRKSRRDLPSWVPDWTVAFDDYDRRRINLCDRYDACNGFGVTICDSERSYLDHLAHQMRLMSQYVNDRSICLPRVAKTVLLYFKDELQSRRLEFGDIGDIAIPTDELVAHRGRNTELQSSRSLINFSFLIHLTKGQVSETTPPSSELRYMHASLPRNIKKWSIFYNRTVRDPKYFKYTRHKGSLSNLNAVKEWERKTKGPSDCLMTRAILVDIVSSCREPLFSIDDDRAIHESIESWMNESKKINPSIQRLDILKALVSDLKLTEGGIERLQTSDYESLQQWYKSWTFKHLDTKAEVVEDTNAETQNPYRVIMRTTLLRRKLFVTSKGLPGHGPYTMQEGDFIYILPGGKTPFVLRKKAGLSSWKPEDGFTEQYQLVGDCYLQGAMDCEPWLPLEMKPERGSLPDDIFLIAYKNLFQKLKVCLDETWRLKSQYYLPFYIHQFWMIKDIESYDSYMDEFIYEGVMEPGERDEISGRFRPLLVDFLAIKDTTEYLDSTLVLIS